MKGVAQHPQVNLYYAPCRLYFFPLSPHLSFTPSQEQAFGAFLTSIVNRYEKKASLSR